MKFRFCGDTDCPDWLLMQINTLSSLNAASLEKLCEHIILSFFDENDLNYAEVEGLTSGTLLDQNDVKACLSAVRQILHSSACHGVTKEELTAELEQLGLESTQSSVIGAVYHRHRHRLTEKLRNETIRMARLKKVEAERSSSEDEYLVKMSILNETTDKLENKSFNITKDQLSVLLHDLKKLKSRMSELQNKSEN